MDMSKLNQGQIIAGLGGIVLVVSLFLSWVSGFTVSVATGSASTSASAFDAFSGMDIIMLIVGIAALGLAVAGATGTNLPPGAAPIVSLLGVVVFGWALGWCLENSNAGFGAWLGLVASVAIVFGAFEAGREPRPVARQRPSSGVATPSGSTGPPTA